MNTRYPHKRRFFKTHHQKRFALYFVSFLVWLGLVITLPKRWSNFTAGAGLMYGYIRLARWGHDPDGEPEWGCFPHMKQSLIQIEIDRNLTAEQKAQYATEIQKQTLLRAAQAESEPAQELLRPATDAGENKPGRC